MRGRMSPVKVSPATCHLSVQCSAALQYSAGQPCSRLVNLQKNQKKYGEKTHTKIIKTENNRIVSPQAKVNDMPLTRFLFISKSGCFAMAHINTQTQKNQRTTDRWTWPGPEGQVFEIIEPKILSFVTIFDLRFYYIRRF